MEMTSNWVTAYEKNQTKVSKINEIKKSGDSYGDVTKALNVIIICFENYSNKYI